MNEQELRAGLRRLAPEVDEDGVWEALHTEDARSTDRTMHRADEGCHATDGVYVYPRWSRMKSKKRRIVEVTAAAIVILAAAGFGGYLLVERAGDPGPLVMGFDGEMSPSSADGGTSVPDPSEVATLTGIKRELWDEIQRIRAGIVSGTLTLEWPAPEERGGGFPADSLQLLDLLEQSLLRSAAAVAVYLSEDADASALEAELTARPDVLRVELTPKEAAFERRKRIYADKPEVFEGLIINPLPAMVQVWLKDGAQAQELVEELRVRPEIDEVHLMPSAMDEANWLDTLRRLTRPVEAEVTRLPSNESASFVLSAGLAA